jgi:hypothetical protein
MAGRDEAEAHEHKATDLEFGTPGASARARYDALRERDDLRRQQTFGRLAPLARLLAGPNRPTEAWGRGADGEERIGSLLSRATGEHGVVLHDRSVPHRPTNIDHIAIMPSGIWLIDSKHYRGRLERRTIGGWFRSRPALYVAGRDKSDLVAGALRQRALVRAAAGPDVPVRAALCFTGTEWSLFARPFSIDEVLITWPRALTRVLRARGPLSARDRNDLAARLASVFPPYVPR